MIGTENEVQAFYLGVLAGLGQVGPRPLEPRLALELEGTTHDPSVAALAQYLNAKNPNDPVRMALSLQLAKWDSEEGALWSEQTQPRTAERRQCIYKRLSLAYDVHATFDDLFPVMRDRHVVIAEEFEPWYMGSRVTERAFYWPAYERYLIEHRHWPDESVIALNDSTTDVVGRLADPTRRPAYQSKGLVVGYVQSGKTANFTGVLAKAIDAGYRLLIVMTGTIDLLREQTQRRIDMELVGCENILRDISQDDHDLMRDVDYQEDEDWISGNFLRHGMRPSVVGHPDIIRLTSHRFDYRSLKAGISSLDFERRDLTRPLYDPRNLVPLRCSTGHCQEE